jgi:D-methionine transport system ATP-binding protein
VETLLEFVELADKKDAYPWQLSGGQKQRVGIARALATNPRILLCDEATSALDPETTGSILELLARVNREMNITILFVTHQVQVIKELCRKVAVMEQGQIVETGSAVDIFSHPQREVTRRFVQAVIPDAIPKSLYTMLQQEQRPFRLLRLRFLGENAKENILFRINTELHVESSVLFASVNEIQKQIVSVFIVQFIGSVEQLEEVAKLLESRGVAYEEVESYESRSA